MANYHRHGVLPGNNINAGPGFVTAGGLEKIEMFASDDERIKHRSRFREALIRPELGEIVGTIVVFVLFVVFAVDSGMFNSQGIMNWSQVSAQFMIIAVGACLLMIVGEFDLSVGSMIGFSGMMIAIFGVTLGWPIWRAILVTFALALSIGALTGFIVVRTGLPSFIVSLAFLFILRGFTISLPQTIERHHEDCNGKYRRFRALA